MSLPTQPEAELKLDFEDLVQELAQCEREAVELQGRITSFITTATEAAHGSDDSDDSEDELEDASEVQDVDTEGSRSEPVIIAGPVLSTSAGYSDAAD